MTIDPTEGHFAPRARVARHPMLVPVIAPQLPEHRLVLVSASAEVPVAASQLRRRLSDARQWLAPLAEEAEEEGRSAVLRVGPATRPELLGRRVRAQILGTMPGPGGSIVAWLRWEAVERQVLFPVLDGELQVTPLDAARSCVTLVGSYVPPLGALGNRLDRRLLHRVAERTVRVFVERLAAGLADWAPAEITLPPRPDSPAAARHFVDTVDAPFVAEVDRDVLRLLVSELVSRAVGGHSPVRVRLIPMAAGVVAEVSDADPVAPGAARSLEQQAPGEVFFVDRLADGWGVTPVGAGKTVWFRLTAAA